MITSGAITTAPSTVSRARPLAVPTAQRLADRLLAAGLGPFFGTPCGILAPLYRVLAEQAALVTVTREDNAVGVAAGAALAGGQPVVIMQNSGLGQCVNALASLVVPYRIPMLLIVSLRGTGPDPTPENTVMGRLSESLLTDLGIPPVTADEELTDLDLAIDTVRSGNTAALLIPPALFGWRA